MEKVELSFFVAGKENDNAFVQSVTISVYSLVLPFLAKINIAGLCDSQCVLDSRTTIL